ncbi:MAG: polysaccharide biosynthesis protein [Anaerolineae bacterium]|nr:polysaccharide biosynthesis protein [Anaerolineae bacterium]
MKETMRTESWWRHTVKRVARLRNRYLLTLDILLIPLAAHLAFVLRLEKFDLGYYAQLAWLSAGIAIAIKIPLLAALGVYARYWAFAGIPEVALLLEAAVVGAFLQAGGVSVFANLFGLPPLPRSVPLIDLLLTTTVITAPRLALRWVYSIYQNHYTPRPASMRRVLIVGAGEAGRMVLREVEQNPQLGMELVGFADDDARKQGLFIGSLRVLGGVKDIPELIRRNRIEQVLIAIPSASAREIRDIVNYCQGTGVQTLILPGFYELLSGRVKVQALRPVRVEDLLSRKPIYTDISRVTTLLRGRRVMVTGAGGSIGSELCRQIASCSPGALILVGHGENSIFHIHNELKRDFPDIETRPVIADIRDVPRLHGIFATLKPEIIFHAAAHKHVPLMERNPQEAVTNNVAGTRNLLQLAMSHGASHFVLISTDKAVHPTSIMGATKRIAELLVQDAARRSGRCFVAVRFGNVLGSRGSVVPLFQKQIAAGGPVTVTHPEISRYFMTIPEAVQLVLQAAALGNGSEVFVLDMGEPVKIVDLARDVIRLAGLREGEDIEIVFTGLRPGEKLYEELFIEGEHHRRTLHEKVFVSTTEYRQNPTLLHENVTTLLEAAQHDDLDEVIRLIETIVPECSPGFGDNIKQPLKLEPGVRITKQREALVIAPVADALADDRPENSARDSADSTA